MVTKNALLSFRIDPELKKQATRLAKAESQSFSHWLIKLIADQVQVSEGGRSAKPSNRTKNPRASR